MKKALLTTAAIIALSAGGASAKELKSIGISLGSMGNPFFVALAKGAEAEAKKINPNVKVNAVGYDYDLN
jgi:ribose transport system substrate-binding protein